MKPVAFWSISRTQRRNKIRYVLAIKPNAKAEEICEFLVISLNSGAEENSGREFKMSRDNYKIVEPVAEPWHHTMIMHMPIAMQNQIKLNVYLQKQ